MGNLILSLAIAFGGHMLVEAPFANLERLLFSSMRSSSDNSSSNVLCQVKTTQYNSEEVKENTELPNKTT